MNFGLTQYADSPTAPALTRAEAKLHLRVDFDDNDSLIDALVDAATQQAEAYCCAAITARDYLMTLSAFPRVSAGQSGPDPDWHEYPSRFGHSGRPSRFPWALQFPVWPVVSVSSVQYLDTAGTLQTLSSSVYAQALDRRPPYIVPLPNQVWPVTYAQPDAVRVRFRAGMAEANGGIPAAVKAAICLILGHLYENREDVAGGMGGTPGEIPMGSRYLLNPYRMFPT